MAYSLVTKRDKKGRITSSSVRVRMWFLTGSRHPLFVQMPLHRESDILSKTTLPCRLEEIRPLLGKDAFSIVQNRITFDLRMQREPYIDLISARRVQDRSDIGELADLPFYLVPATLE